jgi:hypothetical protein
MWWIIVALLAAMSTPAPAPATRGIAPVPEPEQKAVFAAPIERVYLPIVQTHTPLIEGADVTLYGYATPHRRAYSVPFYNWRAIPDDCENENFWPMVRGQVVDPSMVEACDNGRRWLLIYNEPELDHFSATPAEAALFVRDWADRWSGPIACCGNFYHQSGGRDGLDWFLDFIAESGDDPPIDAIHLHVYAWLSVDVDRLHAWRTVADAHGWPIHVTESAIFTSRDHPPDEVAAALPGFLTTVEGVLQPVTLMWFSDYLQPWVLGDGVPWHHFNLTAIDRALTPVGEAWEAYTGRRVADDRQTKTPSR